MRTAGLLAALALIACGPASPESNTPYRSREKPGRGPADVVPPSALAPDRCGDAPLVALADLARGTGDGERVAVDLTPQAEVMCTLLACIGPNGVEDGPDVCCNGCGGNYGLRQGMEFALRLEGLDGCTGMDCNLHCEPFGTAPTHAYRFVGTVAYTPRGSGAIYDQATLTIEKYCRIE
ncbi:MAG: hypothetical protein K8W52_44140 [Deltaproteobacteria bacterium]|nr:hypothetical protein [Deltaproteobacteria bacterium]